MLPLLLERILCKNKNEQLTVSWTKVVINANAKREVCACAHTSVVYGAGNHLHGIPPHPSAGDESESYSNML